MNDIVIPRITWKVGRREKSNTNLSFLNQHCGFRLQLVKATVLAESSDSSILSCLSYAPKQSAQVGFAPSSLFSPFQVNFVLYVLY